MLRFHKVPPSLMTLPRPLILVLRRLVAFVIVAILGIPRTIEGQTPTCDQSAALLLSDSSSREDLWKSALKVIQCHEIGPNVLLELRRHAAPGSVRDTIARQAILAMVDSHMIDSLLALASDPRQPRGDRLFFLSVLTSYADCNTTLRTRDGDPEEGVLYGVLDGCGIYNEQHYAASDRARIRAGFAWIGEHDPDVRLARLTRLAAVELTTWMTLRDSVEREWRRIHRRGNAAAAEKARAGQVRRDSVPTTSTP